MGEDVEDSTVLHLDKVLSHAFSDRQNRLLGLPIQLKAVSERLEHLGVFLVVTDGPIELMLAHLRDVWVRLRDELHRCERTDTVLGVEIVRLLAILLAVFIDLIVQTQHVVLELPATLVPRDSVHFSVDPLHLIDGAIGSLHLLQCLVLRSC